MPPTANGPAEESLLQTQRWEAVGRLAGGVVHDFNNLPDRRHALLRPVCFPASIPIDRRRRYAEEIRSAIMQATGLVKQMLGFLGPKPRQLAFRMPQPDRRGRCTICWPA